MRKFFETLSVFVANVLRLKPISWAESKQEALAMKANMDCWIGSPKVEIDGKDVWPVAPVTPFGYLSDAILAALGFVLAVWLVVKIVSGILTFLPFLLMLAVLAWAIGKYAQPKGQNLAS